MDKIIELDELQFKVEQAISLLFGIDAGLFNNPCYAPTTYQAGVHHLITYLTEIRDDLGVLIEEVRK